jgi:hypothetical protein
MQLYQAMQTLSAFDVQAIEVRRALALPLLLGNKESCSFQKYFEMPDTRLNAFFYKEMHL